MDGLGAGGGLFQIHEIPAETGDLINLVEPQIGGIGQLGGHLAGAAKDENLHGGVLFDPVPLEPGPGPCPA